MFPAISHHRVFNSPYLYSASQRPDRWIDVLRGNELFSRYSAAFHPNSISRIKAHALEFDNLLADRIHRTLFGKTIPKEAPLRFDLGNKTQRMYDWLREYVPGHIPSSITGLFGIPGKTVAYSYTTVGGKQ